MAMMAMTTSSSIKVKPPAPAVTAGRDNSRAARLTNLFLLPPVSGFRANDCINIS